MGSPCGQGASWSPQRCRVHHGEEMQDVSLNPTGTDGAAGSPPEPAHLTGVPPFLPALQRPTLFPGTPVGGFSSLSPPDCGCLCCVHFPSTSHVKT